MRSGQRWHRVWFGALAVFALAGTTGALYRFGVLYGLPAGLRLTHVRHAHSHLMYFGWVTPLLMALIVTHLSMETKRVPSRGFAWIIGLTFVLALASYPAFLAYGYDVAAIGDAELPVAAIISGLNIFAWYAFVVLYLRATWRVARTRPMRLWDVSLGALVLASFGAWGRAGVMGLGLESPFLAAATVFLFLDIFAEGWFTLALLGLLYVTHDGASGRLSSWGSRLLITGLPVTFLLSVPAAYVPAWLRLVAGAGGMLVAVGLLIHIRALWPAVGRIWWRIPLAFLALKALAEFAGGVPPIMAWALQAGLRIPYLHVLLLGFVSLGLFAAARDAWGPAVVRGHRWMIGAISLLLASLVPLTGLWPAAWGGRWTLAVAAWTATVPVLVALAALLRLALQRPPLPSAKQRSRHRSGRNREPPYEHHTPQ